MPAPLCEVNAHNLPSLLLEIARDIQALGGTCYLVGGQVRDQLLGRVDGRDFDTEVYHINGEQLLSVLQKYGKPNLVGKSFGVYHLVRQGIEYDFSFPRTESKVGVGHRAFTVETDPNLDFKTAASRRDFTINAMGLELPSLRLQDEFDGRADLQNRVLRHVGPAFSEDSLRVLRGVQFAARFELTMHPDTVELCRQQDLRDLSKERVWEEFAKWLGAAKPSLGLRYFAAMDLSRFFPQVQPWSGSWEALGLLLDKCRACALPTAATREVLMLSALLSGCATAAEVKEFLHSVTQEQKILQAVPALWSAARELVEQISTATSFSDGDLRRKSLQTPWYALLPLAQKQWEVQNPQLVYAWDHLALRCQNLGIWEQAPQPWLTGKMLQQLGLKPGKHFGEIIAASFAVQLEGEIGDAEQALQWARDFISSGNF